MFQITSKNGVDDPDNGVYNFVNFIKTQLGAPVINIEVSNRQIQLVIDKTIKDFHRYNYGEGNFLDYAVFTTSAGVSTYNLSGQNINDVVSFDVSSDVDGINTLFSPTHILLQEQGVGSMFSVGTMGYGGSPGVRPDAGMGGGVPQVGMQLTSYTIASQYLALIKDMFGKIYSTNWIPWKEELIIVPTPPTQMIGLLTLYRKENELALYNCGLVQDLATARTKILWGEIIAKYSVTLPGSGTINGERLIQEGKEEEERILTEIRGQSEPIDMMIG